MKVSGIYAISHADSGKMYIGSSVDIAGRLRGHTRLLNTGAHPNQHLQAAWTLYGAGAFTCSTLKEVSNRDDLYKVEQIYLDKLRTFERTLGYNKAKDTTAPQRGLKRSPETCLKIGAAKKGNKYRLGAVIPAEMRSRIATTLRGTKASVETKAKLSAVGKGRKKSVEWRAKMSAIHKGRIISDEQRAKISATLRQRFAGPRIPKVSKKLGRPIGIPMSDEAKNKLRVFNTGKVLSAEHRAKIKATHSTQEARTLTSVQVRARRSPSIHQENMT
jgi:group I intron endonuclease